MYISFKSRFVSQGTRTREIAQPPTNRRPISNAALAIATLQARVHPNRLVDANTTCRLNITPMQVDKVNDYTGFGAFEDEKTSYGFGLKSLEDAE
jgi:hypothetical protein